MNNFVILTDSMNTCPKAWQNFFDAECYNGPTDRNGVTAQYINEKLKQWHAEYQDRDFCGGKIVFKTEAHKTFWLLRWA